MAEYTILFGKKPESKDLSDPKHFTELYRTETNLVEDLKLLKRKVKKYLEQGYKLAVVEINAKGELDKDDTLEVKITKSYLKPSPKGTLGCDFDI